MWCVEVAQGISLMTRMTLTLLKQDDWWSVDYVIHAGGDAPLVPESEWPT